MTEDDIINEALDITQKRVENQQDPDLDLIERGAAEARNLIAHIEKTRDEQPARLADMRNQAAIERDRCLVEEPWLDHVGAIPSYTKDGELSGMLALPTVDAKEIWGSRLAFDAVSSDKPAADVVVNYFRDIKDPEHMMLILTAAVDTLADYIVAPLLDEIEQRGGDYEARVRLADAARNAWAARISEGMDK
ncbi:MAG: hypothetical protein CME34_18830 [Gordonia sp.]|uniref:hypothetical protein n=1 Tax=Gordonia sp. (in: high G+C Gram-positive bacteria) TaxID=84139 RepID=UPI000C561C64|nr:hypothetical protein [Gordonia sp. (in: high G+C Gram-positive bacteria)]MAU83882.1 hypothetical protein [Gordonia sp. (in: high G+C Gram-positive bacteria)]